jgi:hypothetical protein
VGALQISREKGALPHFPNCYHKKESSSEKKFGCKPNLFGTSFRKNSITLPSLLSDQHQHYPDSNSIQKNSNSKPQEDLRRLYYNELAVQTLSIVLLSDNFNLLPASSPIN